jgi:hypothetical protein
MNYRLAYDVLNDGFPWIAVAFSLTPLLLAIACLLVILERAGKAPVTTPRFPGRIPLEEMPVPLLVVCLLALSSIGVCLASISYQGFMQRQRCKEWACAGQYQVTEGTVADYQLPRGGARFRVADASFDLIDRSAGFTGRFNAPGARHGTLRDGLQVRLTHREGFILRVEIGHQTAN